MGVGYNARHKTIGLPLLHVLVRLNNQFLILV